MTIERPDWIDQVYLEAECASAMASVKRVAQTERCGCKSCLAEVKRIYTEWHVWGQTGRKPEKVIYKGEKPKLLAGPKHE